jgi:membrane-bound ClpP family serine protease
LIIHSGGGRSEAAEQIVSYMRQKYRVVRAIIPLHAMSAATMLACSCNEIVMGKQSAIGPIDPQIRLGNMQMAAHAILEDVAAALADVRANPATAAIWVPKLQQIPLGMLSQCKQSVARSKTSCGNGCKPTRD